MKKEFEEHGKEFVFKEGGEGGPQWSLRGFVLSAMTLMTKLMYRDTRSCCFPICASIRSLRIFTKSSCRDESNRSWGKQRVTEQAGVEFSRKAGKQGNKCKLPSTECH